MTQNKLEGMVFQMFCAGEEDCCDNCVDKVLGISNFVEALEVGVTLSLCSYHSPGRLGPVANTRNTRRHLPMGMEHARQTLYHSVTSPSPTGISRPPPMAPKPTSEYKAPVGRQEGNRYRGLALAAAKVQKHGLEVCNSHSLNWGLQNPVCGKVFITHLQPPTSCFLWARTGLKALHVI